MSIEFEEETPLPPGWSLTGLPQAMAHAFKRRAIHRIETRFIPMLRLRRNLRNKRANAQSKIKVSHKDLIALLRSTDSPLFQTDYVVDMFVEEGTLSLHTPGEIVIYAGEPCAPSCCFLVKGRLDYFPGTIAWHSPNLVSTLTPTFDMMSRLSYIYKAPSSSSGSGSGSNNPTTATGGGGGSNPASALASPLLHGNLQSFSFGSDGGNLDSTHNSNHAHSFHHAASSTTTSGMMSTTNETLYSCISKGGMGRSKTNNRSRVGTSSGSSGVVEYRAPRVLSDLATSASYHFTGFFAVPTDSSSSSDETIILRVPKKTLEKIFTRELTQEQQDFLMWKTTEFRDQEMMSVFPLHPLQINESWLFRGIGNDMLRTLTKSVQPFPLVEGQVIAQRGKRLAHMLFVQRGLIALIDEKEEQKMILGPGSIYGEREALFRERLTVTVVAMTNADVLALSVRTMQQQLTSNEVAQKTLNENAAQRRQRDLHASFESSGGRLIESVRRTPLLPPHLAETMLPLLKPRVFAAGDHIVDSTCECDRIIYLTRGCAVVRGLRDETGGEVLFQRGECIGFTCMISHRWKHTIIAAEPVDTWELSREDFYHWLKKHTISAETVQAVMEYNQVLPSSSSSPTAASTNTKSNTKTRIPVPPSSSKVGGVHHNTSSNKSQQNSPSRNTINLQNSSFITQLTANDLKDKVVDLYDKVVGATFQLIQPFFIFQGLPRDKNLEQFVMNPVTHFGEDIGIKKKRETGSHGFIRLRHRAGSAASASSDRGGPMMMMKKRRTSESRIDNSADVSGDEQQHHHAGGTKRVSLIHGLNTSLEFSDDLNASLMGGELNDHSPSSSIGSPMSSGAQPTSGEVDGGGGGGEQQHNRSRRGSTAAPTASDVVNAFSAALKQSMSDFVVSSAAVSPTSSGRKSPFSPVRGEDSNVEEEEGESTKKRNTLTWLETPNMHPTSFMTDTQMFRPWLPIGKPPDVSLWSELKQSKANKVMTSSSKAGGRGMLRDMKKIRGDDLYDDDEDDSDYYEDGEDGSDYDEGGSGDDGNNDNNGSRRTKSSSREEKKNKKRKKKSRKNNQQQQNMKDNNDQFDSSGMGTFTPRMGIPPGRFSLDIFGTLKSDTFQFHPATQFEHSNALHRNFQRAAAARAAHQRAKQLSAQEQSSALAQVLATCDMGRGGGGEDGEFEQENPFTLEHCVVEEDFIDADPSRRGARVRWDQVRGRYGAVSDEHECQADEIRGRSEVSQELHRHQVRNKNLRNFVSSVVHTVHGTEDHQHQHHPHRHVSSTTSLPQSPTTLSSSSSPSFGGTNIYRPPPSQGVIASTLKSHDQKIARNRSAVKKLVKGCAVLKNMSQEAKERREKQEELRRKQEKQLEYQRYHSHSPSSSGGGNYPHRHYSDDYDRLDSSDSVFHKNETSYYYDNYHTNEDDGSTAAVSPMSMSVPSESYNYSEYSSSQQRGGLQQQKHHRHHHHQQQQSYELVPSKAKLNTKNARPSTAGNNNYNRGDSPISSYSGTSQYSRSSQTSRGVGGGGGQLKVFRRSPVKTRTEILREKLQQEELSKQRRKQLSRNSSSSASARLRGLGVEQLDQEWSGRNLTCLSGHAVSSTEMCGSLLLNWRQAAENETRRRQAKVREDAKSVLLMPRKPYPSSSNGNEMMINNNQDNNDPLDEEEFILS